MTGAQKLRTAMNVAAALLIAGVAVLVMLYAPGGPRSRDLCPRPAIVHGHTICNAATAPRRAP